MPELSKSVIKECDIKRGGITQGTGLIPLNHLILLKLYFYQRLKN